MEGRDNMGEVLSAGGIRLRWDEIALMALTLTEDSAGEGPSNRGWLPFTERRMFHIFGPGVEAQIKSYPSQDANNAVLKKQTRYHVFLFSAMYFFVVGFPYLIDTAVAAASQGIVLVLTLMFGGRFLVIGGIPVVSQGVLVTIGDA